MAQEKRESDPAKASSSHSPDTERGYPPTPETLSLPLTAESPREGDASGVAAAGSEVAAPTSSGLPETISVPMETSASPGEGNFRDTLKDEKLPHAGENLSSGASMQTMRSLPQSVNLPGKGSNTTLQSMKRPEETPGEVPHSRRFLRIENDVDQARASIKLLKKALEKAQREARFAWIVALVAAMLAGAALAL
jgi:hypothetical protein